MASEKSRPDLEERVSEIEKRHKVEETVQKYVRAVDSQNVELLRSIFAEDSVVGVGPGETYGGPTKS